MSHYSTKNQEQMVFESLLKEAHEILNSSRDLNDRREELTGILDKIVSWKDDGSKEEEYFHQFQKMLVKMSVLNFSKRLPVNSDQKSLQNLISYSLNKANEELEEKVFSKPLLDVIMKELNLESKMIIVTDSEDYVKSVFTGLGNFNSLEFEGSKIPSLFDNLKTSSEYLDLTQNVKVSKWYNGDVKVKMKAAYNKFTEDKAFIVEFDSL